MGKALFCLLKRESPTYVVFSRAPLLSRKKLQRIVFCLCVGNGVGKAKGTCGVYSVSPWYSWWAVQDLNLWHPPCKGGALPTELTARSYATPLIGENRPEVKGRGVFSKLSADWRTSEARYYGGILNLHPPLPWPPNCPPASIPPP